MTEQELIQKVLQELGSTGESGSAQKLVREIVDELGVDATVEEVLAALDELF